MSVVLICSICDGDIDLLPQCKCLVCRTCQCKWLVTKNTEFLSRKEPYYQCAVCMKDFDVIGEAGSKIINLDSGSNKKDLASILLNISIPPFKAQIDQLLLQKYLINSKDCFKCPKKDCNYAGFLDTSSNQPVKYKAGSLIPDIFNNQLVDINNSQPCTLSDFNCLNCNTLFNIPQASNPTNTLKSKIARLLKITDFDITKFNITFTTRPCPKCGISINKISGCNHMICSNCNTDFCYFCGLQMAKSTNTQADNFKISTIHNNFHNRKQPVIDILKIFFVVLFLMKVFFSISIFNSMLKYCVSWFICIWTIVFWAVIFVATVICFVTFIANTGITYQSRGLFLLVFVLLVRLQFKFLSFYDIFEIGVSSLFGVCWIIWRCVMLFKWLVSVMLMLIGLVFGITLKLVYLVGAYIYFCRQARVTINRPTAHVVMQTLGIFMILLQMEKIMIYCFGVVWNVIYWIVNLFNFY